MLLRKLSDVVSKLNVNTILVATEDVCPDAKHDILFVRDILISLHTGLITLCLASVLLLVLSNLLRSKLGVHVHKLKDLGADLVKLLKFDIPEHGDVLVAPSELLHIIHSKSFSHLILHRANDVLRNLAESDRGWKIRLWCLTPLSDEGVEVSLAINVWKGVAGECLSL